MASCGETVPTQELNEKLLNFSAIAHDLTPKVWICFTLGGERGWNTYHGTLVLEVGHEKWKLHLITAGVQLRLLYDEEFDSLLRYMYICPVYWHVEWKKQKKPEEGFALKIYTVGYKARSKGSWVPEEEKGLFEDWYLSISGGEESADGPAYADLVLKQKYRDATIWEAVSEGGYHVGLRVKVVAGFQGWYMQHFRDGRLAIGNSEALKKNIESLGQAEWVDGRAMRYEKQLQARYARPTPNSVGPLWSTRCLGFSEHKMITTSDLRVSDSHDLEVSRIGLGSTVLPKGDPRIVDWHVEWKEEGKPEEGFALTIYIVRQGYQPEERPRSFEDWYLSISQDAVTYPEKEDGSPAWQIKEWDGGCLASAVWKAASEWDAYHEQIQLKGSGGNIKGWYLHFEGSQSGRLEQRRNLIH
uniref:Uncharacterized protein n=1 Tax=Chromera velia CCMP2878 TaxID=1169474 RepID=A0A0G4GBK4_9ALVE|eukprot:Cvel_21037.t1-p1 / transcript=Cvel_21037.t1 / gene=Cvel_21037 / organism=Chromera_velia_CCMP2878 / gene_product=hypothetical protein / transcript_product=hypothetical protein / location=Cvel_scaffold1941:5094-7714(+) / protein_length=413 / sequence_SO=supercontig / SO=protein_coding / is_pseudo=false